MNRRLKKLLWIAPLAMVGLAAFIALGGEVVKLLWNWLAPALFGWPQITFWQAVGLLALCRILFGGFRLGAHDSARVRIRERMAERWEKMTPEEREKYRQSWRGRWGSFEPPDSKSSA